MAIQGSLRVLGVPAAAAALVIGAGGAIWLWSAYGHGDASDGPQGRPEACAQALEFARGSLPEGVRDERCARTDGPDASVSGLFRLDRDRAVAWLDAAYPKAQETGRTGRPTLCPKVGPGYDPEGGDRCLTMDYADALPGRAARVEISLESEAGSHVRIKFAAHPR